MRIMHVDVQHHACRQAACPPPAPPYGTAPLPMPHAACGPAPPPPTACSQHAACLRWAASGVTHAQHAPTTLGPALEKTGVRGGVGTGVRATAAGWTAPGY
eukprot:1161445-Pelagomonas_calceolata.AAC.5